MAEPGYRMMEMERDGVPEHADKNETRREIMPLAGEPPLHLLDVVDLVSPEDEDRAPVGRLVVVQVRLLRNTEWRFSVCAVDDLEWTQSIYRADQLRATGGRVSLQEFALPGQFAHRDIVHISNAHPDPTLAGRNGVVDGWAGGSHPVVVWLPDIEEIACFREDELTSTGRKAPKPEPSGEISASAQVDASGNLLGTSEYVIIDDIEFHL